MNLRKTTTTLAATTALATLTLLASPVLANSMFRVRAGAAVLRGHSMALPSFLKGKCRVAPQLGAAHAHANQLANQADRLWDMTRCHTPPAALEAQLCAIQRSYEQTDRLVRSAMRFGPRHHFTPACHLLELIEKQICKVRENLARLTPAVIPTPPVHPASHGLGQPALRLDYRDFNSPALTPRVLSHRDLNHRGHGLTGFDPLRDEALRREALRRESLRVQTFRPSWARPSLPPAAVCNATRCGSPCTNRDCHIHHGVRRPSYGNSLSFRIGGLRFSF